jgi:hypothetical protein
MEERALLLLGYEKDVQPLLCHSSVIRCSGVKTIRNFLLLFFIPSSPNWTSFFFLKEQ